MGPLEVFANANDLAGSPVYSAAIIGITREPVMSEAGLTLVPDLTMGGAGDFDTIIVPGGQGLRVQATQSVVATWVRERTEKTRRIASVCTGIYALAAAGLLDGRKATTHWRFIDAVRDAFPAIQMQRDCIYVEDGRFMTSGGICAGIDLALAMVRADLGPSLALAVAREMVVPGLRGGGQAQFSEPLRAQTRAPHRLADLVAWIGDNLAADLSLPVLAERARIGERQLSRLFVEGLGESPGALIARLRMQAARDLLTGDRLPVGEVARLVGYRSADAFGRAYRRAYGVAPEDASRPMSETAG